jgi:predicted DNA-binding transcriptional regulator YafY
MTAEPGQTPVPAEAASQRKVVAKADGGVPAERATTAEPATTGEPAKPKAGSRAKAGTRVKAGTKAKPGAEASVKVKPAVATKPAVQAEAAGAARTAVTATATERLQRLLALVPYVISRNVVGMAETAAAFGVTERELVDDLNLLWCVELRSPDPYCPIDLSYEGGEIVVSEAEAFGRPLRLGVDEASALLIALRMLTALPAVADGTALSRTIAKLEAAAGAAAEPSAKVAVQVNVQAAAAQVADALRRGRRLHLRHYAHGRDEATERDVDPMRLLVVDGRDYLEGWCRRAEDVRLFRLDRVLAIEVLDVPAEVPAGVEQIDVDRGLFRPSPQDIEVEFELSSAGQWVAEYYPCEQVEQLADGRLRIRLRTPDTQLVRRLALRLGEDGRLLAPAALADQVAADAMAALSNYAR